MDTILIETDLTLCMCIRSKSDTYIHHAPRYNSDRGYKYPHTTSKCFQLIKVCTRTHPGNRFSKHGFNEL